MFAESARLARNERLLAHARPHTERKTRQALRIMDLLQRHCALFHIIC